MIVASTLAGIYAYVNLGRAEDPPFAFKQVMTIRTDWPGATTREIARFITDPIEKKLEELPYFNALLVYIRGRIKSVIILVLKDYTPPSRVPDLWYQVRKKVGDIRDSLPAGQEPFFNDEFGDIYSFIYAFMGKDFAPAQMKKIIEEVRERIPRHSGRREGRSPRYPGPEDIRRSRDPPNGVLRHFGRATGASHPLQQYDDTFRPCRHRTRSRVPAHRRWFQRGGGQPGYRDRGR